MPRTYKPVTKWNETTVEKIYELAKNNLKNREIAEALGIKPSRWNSWMKLKPQLKKVLKKARDEFMKGHDPFPRKVAEERLLKEGKSTERFLDYVYRRLPGELQQLWQQLCRVDQSNPDDTDRIEAILEKRGENVRKHLFVHALVCSNFNSTEAARRLNVCPMTIQRWLQSDPNFGQLILSVHNMKKDYVESALFERIDRGDTTAIIYANRCLNADRGYNPTKKVDVNGNLYLHDSVSLEDLNALPLEDRVRILDALERNKTKKLPPKEVQGIIEEVVDAESN